MTYVEYSANNSGGSWWLKDEHWKALEQAGWRVQWVRDEPSGLFRDKDGERFLGALARRAYKLGSGLREAIAEWERVTGQDSAALGCSCCGTPHSFYLYAGDDPDGGGTWLGSYSPEAPSSGSRYDGE